MASTQSPGAASLPPEDAPYGAAARGGGAADGAPGADGGATARDGVLRMVAVPGLTLAVRTLPRDGGGHAAPAARDGSPAAGGEADPDGSPAAGGGTDPDGFPAAGGEADPDGGGTERQPALLVHGLGGSSLNWLPLMRRIGHLVDAEALDLPGFGHSPPPDDGDYSTEALARAVIRYLDASGRGPVHLAGNSLGGTVVVRVAAWRPDLVRTLTLVSPALPEVPPQHTALPTVLVGLPGAAALFARATRDWTAERRVRLTVETCYGDPSRISEEELAAAAEEYRRRVRLPYFWDVMTRSMRGIVATYTARGARSLWRQAQAVTVPVLLVYGVRDKLVSYRMARRACAAFHDARLLVLPDSGHVAMLEHPDAVARAFRELLETRMREPSAGRS